MAVAETRKMEKGDAAAAAADPSWLGNAMGWGPKKLAEGKAFVTEVRSELRKVTWPGREEVKSTTIVVVITTVFFGFYLFALDLVFTQAFALVLR